MVYLGLDPIAEAMYPFIDIESESDQAADNDRKNRHHDVAALDHALHGNQNDAQAQPLHEEVAQIVRHATLEKQAEHASENGRKTVDERA